MTLDEAIKHCKEKAKDLRCEADFITEQKEMDDCYECAREHEQLAEWLTELKGLRLLAEWAVQCDFGYDNIPEEYAKHKDTIKDMDYVKGLIYIATKEAEQGASNE